MTNKANGGGGISRQSLTRASGSNMGHGEIAFHQEKVIDAPVWRSQRLIVNVQVFLANFWPQSHLAALVVGDIQGLGAAHVSQPHQGFWR